MNFEPQKFFIGLIDFFSVWLPGALLVYLMKDELGLLLLGHAVPIAGTEGWLVFLFASYLVGQFVFLLGALLDERLYDPMRNGTHAGQLDRLAAGQRLSSRLVRWIGGGFFDRDDKALRQVLRLKAESLGGAGANSAVNAFQWSKARLALDHPAAIAEVQRFEADSKFFRSLCAILIVMIAWQLVKWVAALAFPGSLLGAEEPWRPLLFIAAAAFVLIFAFWRYAERRSKAILQAYWFVLTDFYRGEAASPAAPAPPDGLTHAGGVVLRYRGGRLPEYLRVEAQGAPGLWVLPKGHIEADEQPARTAVREVLEESGVWARVHEPLETIAFKLDGSRVKARFFLMEMLEPARRKKRKAHPWLPGPKARSVAARKTDWKTLDDYGDLPLESHKVVEAALSRFRPQAATSAAASAARA